MSRAHTRQQHQLQQEIEDRKFEEDEEAKRREADERNINQKYFIDAATKKPFDPTKKFGVIEDGNQLVYDNLTTSYALNLPPDYYLK